MSSMEVSSNVRLKAFSLLKIADAIEEASTTCKTTQDNKGSETKNTNATDNISNFMKILEEEQKSILGLVRSSLSDLATVASRDLSEEIPFDERSQSLASLASKDDKSNPVDTRDDDREDKNTRRNRSEGEERVESATSSDLPYSIEKRAELSRSLGPYLYSKIHSSQNQPPKIFASLEHASSTLSSKESGDQKLERSKFMQPTLLPPPHIINDCSSSADSDDTIGKLRHFAEVTFDTADQSSIDSVKDAVEQATASLPTAQQAEPSESTPDQASCITSPRAKVNNDQAAGATKKTLNTKLEKSRLFFPDHSDDQGSISSNSSIAGDARPPRPTRAFSPASKSCRPPKASRKSLKNEETNTSGPDGQASQVGVGRATGSPHRERSNSEEQMSPTGFRLDPQKCDRPTSLPSTPRVASTLRSAPEASHLANLSEHATHSSIGGALSGDKASVSRLQFPETRRKGRQLFSNIKPKKKSKVLNLEQLENPIFVPSTSQSSNPRSSKTVSDHLSTDAKTKKSQAEKNLSEQIRKQISKDKGLLAVKCQAQTTVQLEPSKKSLIEEAHQETHQETGTKEAMSNDRMLQECYSAIASLKNSSESKYQALESKYLELKGSFSHLGTHSRDHDDEEDNTQENLELKSQHREMLDTIAKLELMNSRLLDEARVKNSQHQALKASVLHLEVQNRHLKEAAVERDDKYHELEDTVTQLEERNNQLKAETQLSRKLESACQSIEERCVGLQKGLAELEDRNTQLKRENSNLLSKCQSLEAKSQQLEATNGKLESQTSQQHEMLEAKCNLLEESNNQLQSSNGTHQDDKQHLQARLQALEAKCLVLEESHDQLKFSSSLLQDEKQVLQSKLQTTETKYQGLEQSNNQVSSQRSLLQDEKRAYQSKLEAMESKYQELEASSYQRMSQIRLIEDEKKISQLKLQTTESMILELEESNNQLKAQNGLLQTSLQEMESNYSELERSNKKLAAEKLRLEELQEEIKPKLQTMESKGLEFEQSICHLKAHNTDLEEENGSLKEMLTNLEGGLQEARDQIKDLNSLSHPKDQRTPIQETPQREVDPAGISCISSESSELVNERDPELSQFQTGYEVISSQELLSYTLTRSTQENDEQPEPAYEVKNQTWNGQGIVEASARDNSFEEELRAKLNELASSGSSEASQEEPQFVEALDDDPAEEFQCKEQDENESVKKDTVESAGKATTPHHLGGNPFVWGGHSPRTLPPLSPRPQKPPLCPSVMSSPRQSCNKQPDEFQDQTNGLSEDDFQMSSTNSSISSKDEEELDDSKAAVALPSPRKAPSTILQEILDESDSSDDEEPYSRRQVTVPTESGSHSRRSRKSEGRHNEPKLSKSSSSSKVMAALFGSKEDPKVIPEYVTTQQQRGTMVLHGNNTEVLPMIPTFIEPQAPRSPLRHKPVVDQEVDSPASSREEESNSIVTQTSTDTRDLLNTPSRRAKKLKNQTEKTLVRKTAIVNNKQAKSACDWFMPMDYDPPQSPPTEEISVAPSGCGVDVCTSILARRTWNFGKKQSRVTSGSMIINTSEQFSVVSIMTAPTATTTTVPTGTTSGRQGDTSSFDSHTSDNTTISSKPIHGSSILAKRDKLRRKQGQNVVQKSSSTCSSTSQSENQALTKGDKKIPLKPLSRGGTFPFL